MGTLSLVVVVAFLLLTVANAAKTGTGKGGKSSHAAALPRSKGGKGGKGKGSGKGSSGGLTSSITRSLGGGFMYKVFREMKTAFGSELEALALTLTRPSDAAVSEASLEELQQVYEGEYENPQFTVSLLAKLSRKLVEPNVFTKIKSLLCLHRLMEGAGDKSQEVMLQCIRSLRSELDSKVGQPFFAVEGVKEAGDIASNVGEAEASEVAREYVGYVFDYIDYKGESPRKLGREDATVDRVEALLSLVEQGLAVEDLCKGSAKGGVLKQCSEGCRRNRAWLLKQAARLHELEAWGEDGEARKELEAVLTEFKVKFTPSASSSSSSSSSSSPATAGGAGVRAAEAAAPTAERVSASLGSKTDPASASASASARDEEEEEDEDDEEKKKAAIKGAPAKGKSPAKKEKEEEDGEEEDEKEEEEEEEEEKARKSKEATKKVASGKGKSADQDEDEDEDEDGDDVKEETRRPAPKAAKRPTKKDSEDEDEDDDDEEEEEKNEKDDEDEKPLREKGGSRK